MIALDTTFLLDYLDAEDATRKFLNARASEPFFAPTLSLFEVYRGAARVAGREGVDTVGSSLDWIEPLPLTEEAAREAAVVAAELFEGGEPINLGDVLVAGTCRLEGAAVVTRDARFDRVDGLDVIAY